jgi:hypothetical protein
MKSINILAHFMCSLFLDILIFTENVLVLNAIFSGRIHVFTDFWGQLQASCCDIDFQIIDHHVVFISQELSHYQT